MQQSYSANPGGTPCGSTPPSCFRNPCNDVLSITALALALAKDQSSDCIALMAALAVQLGDTLNTIAAEKAWNEAQSEK